MKCTGIGGLVSGSTLHIVFTNPRRLAFVWKLTRAGKESCGLTRSGNFGFSPQ